MKKQTNIQRFKNHLNELDRQARVTNLPGWKNRRFGPTKRSYGDYLYSQDNDKFMFDMNEWLATSGL